VRSAERLERAQGAAGKVWPVLNSISRKARTRVLVLTDSFSPHAGGSREYYFNIYRSLAELGETQLTILTKKIPGWKEFDKEVSTEWFRIRRWKKPLRSWKIRELPKGVYPFLQTIWYVLWKRPAIIHAGDIYPQGFIAMILKGLFGIPYVIYCHGEELVQTDRYRYVPRVRNRIYLNADAVVANSEFTRQHLLRVNIPDERIHKITPGVDATRFRSMQSRREIEELYGLQGKLILLTVGRLIPRKGHRLVLEALARLSAEIPDLHYLIAGIGPEEQRLRQLVGELGLTERVTFSGYVPQGRLPALYSACDIMVMPNRQEEDADIEGFGMVFLEANAAGKPVVGGKSGGASEAVADGLTGILVNSNDREELTQVLRKLLLDRQMREDMGRAGAHRALNAFAWKQRAQTLASINVNILRGKGFRNETSKLSQSTAK
jgi:phosphatidylinositol alpha-1,6-mannosyltransferase